MCSRRPNRRAQPPPNRRPNRRPTAAQTAAGLDESERSTALLSLWASAAFLAGVGACACVINHLGCKPGTLSSGCTFVPVAVAQWVWLCAHDSAFAEEVAAKQRRREAAELVAAAARARGAVPRAAARAAVAAAPGSPSRRLSADMRSASLPFELQASLLQRAAGSFTQDGGAMDAD